MLNQPVEAQKEMNNLFQFYLKNSAHGKIQL
jgi:hypothetical protein